MAECIFCKIASGQVEADIIYEDENCIAILDKFPAAQGHTLILPKKHYADIFDLDEEMASLIFNTTVKISNAIKKGLKPAGINILQNNGKIAGQTVKHFHIHIIPRQQDDLVSMDWQKLSPGSNEMQHVKNAIQQAL